VQNCTSKIRNSKQLDVTELLLLLQTKNRAISVGSSTTLLTNCPHVDRVIVHLERLPVKNKHSKQFTVELGQTLQRLVDVDSCVEKLSQPHVHRANGPMFRLGKSGW